MESKEFGRIVAPNLTQRRTLYDEAGLRALLREGKTHDGHVPWGMPIKMFQHLSDQEVRDIDAWLRALPAVENPELPEGKWSDALAKATADGTHPWLPDMVPDAGNQPPPVPCGKSRMPSCINSYPNHCRMPLQKISGKAHDFSRGVSYQRLKCVGFRRR